MTTTDFPFVSVPRCGAKYRGKWQAMYPSVTPYAMFGWLASIGPNLRSRPEVMTAGMRAAEPGYASGYRCDNVRPPLNGRVWRSKTDLKEGLVPTQRTVQEDSVLSLGKHCSDTIEERR